MMRGRLEFESKDADSQGADRFPGAPDQFRRSPELRALAQRAVDAGAGTLPLTDEGIRAMTADVLAFGEEYDGKKPVLVDDESHGLVGPHECDDYCPRVSR